MGSRLTLQKPSLARALGVVAVLAVLCLQTAVALPTLPSDPVDARPSASLVAPAKPSATGLAFVLTPPTADPAIVAAIAAHGMDPAALLPDLPWAEGVNHVDIEVGTPWRQLPLSALYGDDAPVQGTMRFECPDLATVPSVQNGYNTLTMRASCPYRIIDDADLLGSPQIAVNPNDHNAMAFFSLHGAGTSDGPTPRSRDPSPDGASLTGLSHTTFTSQDLGRSWFDNPWGTDGFGEHASGVMDNDGNLYIAALWSKRLGDGHFDYVIKLYKEGEGRFQISTYQPSKTIANRADGNQIDEANLVFVAAATKFNPYNQTDENGTANATAPAGEDDIGNATNGEAFGALSNPDDRVVVVWHERALDWRNSTTGKSSWIDAAWTDTRDGDNWTRLADDQLIGPCMNTSNPVAYNGQVYVACVVDAGYNGRSRAKIGDIDVWRIDPQTGKTELTERTPLVGGRPRMASRADGYMAIASVDVVSEAQVNVQISFGWFGAHWEAPKNAGSDLHRLVGMTGATEQTGGQAVGGPIPMRDARITAMALTQEKNTLFLVYMERSLPPQTPEANPSTANPNPGQAIEYHKVVTTFDQCVPTPIDAYDLQTGVARHPFQNQEQIVGDATGVFDDLQDGMQYLVGPDGVERVYFAYGDHGVIQYGWLVAGGSGEVCPVFMPLEFFPPPPIPAALSATSPATTLVGSAVGATALAMVTYLLAAKRKTANILATKAKK